MGSGGDIARSRPAVDPGASGRAGRTSPRALGSLQPARRVGSVRPRRRGRHGPARPRPLPGCAGGSSRGRGAGAEPATGPMSGCPGGLSRWRGAAPMGARCQLLSMAARILAALLACALPIGALAQVGETPGTDPAAGPDPGAYDPRDDVVLNPLDPNRDDAEAAGTDPLGDPAIEPAVPLDGEGQDDVPGVDGDGLGSPLGGGGSEGAGAAGEIDPLGDVESLGEIEGVGGPRTRGRAREACRDRRASRSASRPRRRSGCRAGARRNRRRPPRRSPAPRRPRRAPAPRASPNGSTGSPTAAAAAPAPCGSPGWCRRRSRDRRRP